MAVLLSTQSLPHNIQTPLRKRITKHILLSDKDIPEIPESASQVFSLSENKTTSLSWVVSVWFVRRQRLASVSYL